MTMNMGGWTGSKLPPHQNSTLAAHCQGTSPDSFPGSTYNFIAEGQAMGRLSLVLYFGQKRKQKHTRRPAAP